MTAAVSSVDVRMLPENSTSVQTDVVNLITYHSGAPSLPTPRTPHVAEFHHALLLEHQDKVLPVLELELAVRQLDTLDPLPDTENHQLP